MSIVINGTGTITGISAGGLNDGIITQPEIATGVAGTGPAFRGTQSGSVSCSVNVATKITIDTKTFDTANCFNTSTNRFTPNVAGYYQVNASITFFSYTAQYVNLMLYKNGSAVGGFGSGYSSVNGIVSYNLSDLVYCNGTTDYLELYVIQGNGTQNASNGVFSISMVRSA